MSRPAGLSLRVQDAGAGAICADILAALPHWFGFPDSVAAYVESAENGPTVVATLDGRDCGILTLVLHTPYAAEIVVMGVLPELAPRRYRAGAAGGGGGLAGPAGHRVPAGQDPQSTLRRRGVRRHPGLLLRLRLPAAGGDARAVGGGPAGVADDQDRAATAVTEREGRGTDRDYLRERQYKDPGNLNARIALHAKYTRRTCPGSIGSWVRSNGPRVGRCSRSVAAPACCGSAPRRSSPASGSP